MGTEARFVDGQETFGFVDVTFRSVSNWIWKSVSVQEVCERLETSGTYTIFSGAAFRKCPA